MVNYQPIVVIVMHFAICLRLLAWCERAGYSSEVLLGAEISTATTTLDNHVGSSGHVDKKLKETPI